MMYVFPDNVFPDIWFNPLQWMVIWCLELVVLWAINEMILQHQQELYHA